jgi:hypothetical protein
MTGYDMISECIDLPDLKTRELFIETADGEQVSLSSVVAGGAYDHNIGRIDLWEDVHSEARVAELNERIAELEARVAELEKEAQS